MNQNDFLTDEQLDDLLADTAPAGKAFPVGVREKMIASMRAEIFPLEDDKQSGTAQTTTQITTMTPFWERVARWLSGGLTRPVFATLCLMALLSGAGVLAYTKGNADERKKSESEIAAQKRKIEALTIYAEEMRGLADSAIPDDLPIESGPDIAPGETEGIPPRVKAPKTKPTPIKPSPNLVPVYAFPEVKTDRARAYSDFALPDNAVQALITVRLGSDETLEGRVTLKPDSGTEVPCSVLPQAQNSRNLLIQVNARALVNGWYTLTVELNEKTLLGNTRPKKFWSRIFITKG